MSIKKNKIWIISIILINLIFVVFLNNYKIENVGFTNSTNKSSDNNLSDVESSSTNWFDANWQYRKFINITTGSAAVPSDYTVSLTFDHASLVNLGKSRADGNDIRVAYLSGSDWEELDRILDPGSSWNNNSTRIWFKTQAAIPALSSDSNYFLYYGNKLAGLPPNNYSNVFLYYDGFESGNFSAWDSSSIGSPGDILEVSSDQVHTGKYAAKAEVDDVSSAQATIWKDFSDEETLLASNYIYLDPSFNTTDHVTVMQYIDISTGWQNLLSVTIKDDMTLYMWNDYVGEAYGYLATNKISNGNWHLLEVQATFSETTGEARLWLDGNLEIEATMINISNSNSIRYATVYYWGSPQDEPNTVYADDNYLRLWVNPEPTTSLGTETILRASVNDFTYYKVITIDHTKVPGSDDLNNFPILISLFDSDLHDHAQPDGDDIAFYNGSEWLDHEIEIFDQTYNDTHAELIAWVRIPSLSPLIDTNITMYYGNSVIGSQENPAGVWDNNYKGVWHLKEDPSGSQIKDSTSNSLNGISYGSMTSSNQMEGQIGGSLKFDGLNDYIDLGSHPELKLTNAFTFEAWYSGIYNGTVNTRSPIFTNGFSYPNIGIRVEAFHSSAGSTNREARIAAGDGSSVNYVISDYEINDNTWTYLVCTYDGSTLKLYINGTKQIDELDKNIAYNTNTATIGSNLNNSEQWYKGQIDELRFLGKNCSAEWIATEYNNQYNPDSFYSVGTENLVNNYLLHENYFTHYKTITVNHTQVSGNGVLLNFPLLLSIIDSDLRNKVQADGDDIAFAKDNVWLDHEIELFNFTYSPTESQLIAWVKIPFLSGMKDTQFRMYYGNSTMDSQENPNGIWDTNTFGVWHLSEIGNGASDEYKDSSIYNNNGQGGEGDSLFVPNRTTGMIGFGQDFNNLDGKYDLIDCGDNSIFDISGNQITLQAWIKHNITPQAHFYGIMNHKGWYDGYSLWIEQNSLKLAFNLPGDTSQLVSNTDITTNTWHYIVATYDGSYMRIYIDGVQDPNNLTKVNNIKPSSSEKDFWIGHGDQPKDVGWSAEYEGQIDEVRVSNIARTSEWIATEYNNQYSPETFSILSTEHAVSEVPPTSKFFNYYKVITVDHTKINGSGSHTNFPLLISILDEDLHDHVLSSGNDIAFAIGSEWLDHEIELFNQSYSPTQAQLIAWVRIPSLSTSFDTQITMYYGNSTMESQENPMGVWNSGYVGVWHLSEDPTGTIYDSTLNNNDGTTYGSMSSGDQISGKIDGSLKFDGDDDYIDCGNNNSLDITGDITIEFWVNGISFLNDLDPDILTKGDYTHAYSTWINDDGGIYFELNHDSLISTTKLALGEWHHVVCVRSGSNRMIYINGSEDISDSFSSAIETITDTLTIARSPDNLNGTLDEIRLSNVARSAEWIATEYNNLYDPANFYSIGIENQMGADTSAPDITINSPNSNKLFGLSAPNYNLTVIDANLDSIWYSLNGGANSTPVSAIGAVDETMWDALGNGTVTIRFYANDTIGNLNYEEVTVRKDIINPSIIINSPTSGSNHSSSPSYSLSITEANIDEIWYTLDGGLTNYTGALSGTIDSIAWSNAGQGSVTVIFFVNDSAGNWDSASVGINRDSIDPSIDSIDSPAFGAWFTTIPPSYSLSITETNLDTIWYTLDGGLTNYTGALSGTIDSTAWSNAGQGAITITFYVNDSAGNWHSASVGINRDTIDPSIDSIVSPPSGAWFAIIPPSYSLSITETNLDTIWYTLDDGLINYTGAQSGTIDSTAWSNAGQGSVTIIFYVNDSAGNWHSTSVGINRDTIDPSIDSIDSPLPDSNHSAPPSYSLSITETNLDDIWYTLDGGLTNYTGALSGTIDSIAWGNAGLGAVTITFYVNDSVNNWDSASVVITKTSDLSISIISPNIAQWFSYIPDYDVYISGNDRDSIWYTLDNGLTNFTITSTANLSNTWLGLIDSTAWTNAGQGSVTITFYLNNTFGIIVSDSVQINKDTIDPTIDSIDSPAFGAWFATIPPSYSLSITETNLDTIWYTLDGGTTNYTGASSGTIDATAWSNAGEGSVTIIFYVNDSAGNWDSASVITNKDSIDPTIDSIDSPAFGAWFATNPPDYSLSITEVNLDEIWYTLDGGTTNYTGASSGTIDSTAWSNAGEGSVTIIFYVNDSAGNWDSASVIINKDSIDPTITIIKPNNYDHFGTTPPNITINIYDSNLDFSWYQLDNGTVITNNYTWTGFVAQSVWDQVGNGTIIIRFYANDTVGNLANAEVIVYKDIYLPIITIIDPTLNELYTDTAPSFIVSISGSNLDSTWYTLNNGVNNYTFTGLTGSIDQLAWASRADGTVTIKFYINNTVGILGFDEVDVIKDTIAPSAPDLINFPQGVVDGNLLFEWNAGSDLSGILKYRLIIDNEDNPLITPGFVFETNVTGTSYTFTGTLQPGMYYFFLYQIDGAGHQSQASTGSFSIRSNTSPPEFPIWIIFVIIGAAIGGVIGIIVLKKSKGKKEFIPQIPEKKLEKETIQEVPEELSLLDYDILSVMDHNELISREETLLEHIRHLEENKKYGKAAEVIGELILIEDILGNSQEVKLYRQKQIDLAVRGLEYLKDQYEIESKKAALSGDYSKALELYNESKVISDNLKGYMEHQESSDTEENIESGTMEPQTITGEAEIVYSCINDLLTKYFDDIGIKYYSNPQIYEDIQAQVHGLILADQFHLEDIDPLVRESLKSIQIVFTEDMSNATITNLCQTFHNPYVLLIIVGIRWPKNIETQIIEIPPNLGDQYQENTRIIHYELFMTLMGLTGAYETAFKEIIDLYNKSEIEILREIQESSEVIIHSTDELRYDLKEKGLIIDQLEEYFNR